MQKSRRWFAHRRDGAHSGTRSSFLSTQGSALLIVLCFIVLLTIVVAAFLAQSILHRQIFTARAGQTQVDVLASDTIEFMKADFRQEILSGSTNNPAVYSANNSSGVAVPLYIPSTNLTVVPSRTGFLPGSATADPYANIVKISKYQTNFFGSTANPSAYLTGTYPSPNYASPSSTGDPSLNGRYIDNATTGWTTNGWDKPQLIDTSATSGYPNALQSGQIPLPDWTYVTTSGRKVLSAPESDVVGRYAYVVYDEGGLLDINSAGCDASKMSPADAYDVARKASLGFADLTQIPGITSTIQQAVVAWRNHMTSSSSYTTPSTSYPTNAPTYLQYLVDGNLNGGFLKAVPGDQRFLSRQDLIAYAPTLGMPTQSLAYLGTFTRTINAPTWTPIDPPGAMFSTANTIGPPATSVTSYAANAESPYWVPAPGQTWVGPGNISVANRDIINVRWPADVTIVRPALNDECGSNGTAVQTETITFKQGDPVVQHRFPLSKIALLSNPLAQSGVITPPAAGATTGSVAWAVYYYFGLQWVTSDAALAEPHWQYVPQDIMSEAAFVPGITTDGSPGGSGGQTKFLATVHQVALYDTQASTTAAKKREPNFFEMLRAGKLVGSWPGGGAYPFDLGANIIDQFDPDDTPTVINMMPTVSNRLWIGRENLPYLFQVLFWPYRPTSDASRATFEAYAVPELWNPHRNASTPSSSITNIRIIVYNTQGGTWTPSPTNPGTGSWANAAGEDVFASLSVGSGSSNTANYYETDGWNPNIPAASGGPAYVAPDLSLHALSTDPDSTKPALTINSPSSYSFQEPTILTPAMATLSNNPRWALSAVDKESPNRTGFYLGYTTKAPIKAIGTALGVSSTTTATYAQYSRANLVTHGPSSSGFTLRTQYSIDSGATWHTYDESTLGFTNPVFIYANDGSISPGANGDNASPCFSSVTGNDAIDYYGAISQGQLDPRMNGGTYVSRMGSVNTGNLGGWNASITGNGSGAQPSWRPNKNTTTGVSLMFQTGSASTFTIFGYPQFVATSAIPGLYSENLSSLTTSFQDVSELVQNSTAATADVFNGDYVTRPGDGANGAYPMASNNIADRPIILNRPFLSVGELGYAFSGLEWKTINFSSATTGDAGLLDLFSINDTENVDQQSMISGVLDINTHNTAVLQAMIAGGLVDGLDSTGGTSISGSDAQSMAKAIVSETASTAAGHGPLLNRAALATTVAPLPGIASVLAADSYVTKDRREAVVRALAEPADTRTWNLLIDLVVQAGRYPPTAISAGTPAALAQFDVQGERRYWLHIAIDRYTGKVIDEQLEVVHDN